MECNTVKGPFCCELDRGMGLVDLLQELIQVAFSMGPDGEDIVDVAPPNVWFSFCFS